MNLQIRRPTMTTLLASTLVQRRPQCSRYEKVRLANSNGASNRQCSRPIGIQVPCLEKSSLSWSRYETAKIKIWTSTIPSNSMGSRRQSLLVHYDYSNKKKWKTNNPYKNHRSQQELDVLEGTADLSPLASNKTQNMDMPPAHGEPDEPPPRLIERSKSPFSSSGETISQK